MPPRRPLLFWNRPGWEEVMREWVCCSCRKRESPVANGKRISRDGGWIALALLVVTVVLGVGLLVYLRAYHGAPSAPGPAAPATNEPTGFGKARFGMSVEEVRALYPEMEATKQRLGAPVVEGPLISRHVLWKQNVPGLNQPADVELRFWKNQLWVVIVYFGANDLDSVLRALTDQYGAPNKGDPRAPVWSGARSTIIVSAKAKWYSMHDNAISKDAQNALIEDLRRTMEQRRAGRAQPSESGSPAAGSSAAPSGTVPHGVPVAK